MSLKSTIEYLGEWEMLYNPNLIVPNSIQLEMQQEATTSYFQSRPEFKEQALSALFLFKIKSINHKSSVDSV